MKHSDVLGNTIGMMIVVALICIIPPLIGIALVIVAIRVTWDELFD